VSPLVPMSVSLKNLLAPALPQQNRDNGYLC